jgi:hypothetical protein
VEYPKINADKKKTLLAKVTLLYVLYIKVLQNHRLFAAVAVW